MGFCCGGRKLKSQPAEVPNLNVASAILLAKKAGQIAEEHSRIQKRIDLCKSCPHFNAIQSSCNRCGCLLVGKVGKERERCPALRW
jgi:hypothetical protein